MGVGDQEMTVVVARFKAAAGKEEQVAAVLSRYVVLTRGHEGCYNVDLLESEAEPAIFLVIQKWADASNRDDHFNSEDAVIMAQSLNGLLAEAPAIIPYAPVSAYDLM